MEAGPFVTLPSRIRRALEVDVVISLAGPLGERTFGPEWATYEPPTPRRETSSDRIGRLSYDDRCLLEMGNDQDRPRPDSDETRAHRTVRVLAGDEELALDYLRLLRRVAIGLIVRADVARGVSALVPELLTHGDVGGRRVRELLRATGW
jgi:hypothetical protein